MAIFILTGGSIVIEGMVDKIFLVVGDEKGCGLILLPCLGFAAIAFFSEGEVEVVAVEAVELAQTNAHRDELFLSKVGERSLAGLAAF